MADLNKTVDLGKDNQNTNDSKIYDVNNESIQNYKDIIKNYNTIIDNTRVNLHEDNIEIINTSTTNEKDLLLDEVKISNKQTDESSIKDDLHPNATVLYSTEYNLVTGESSPDAGYMTYLFNTNSNEKTSKEAEKTDKKTTTNKKETVSEKDDNNQSTTVMSNVNTETVVTANVDNRVQQVSYDDPAISKYVDSLSDENAINHIFSNPFYRIPAVPHWAFSVDFIPTKELLAATKNFDGYYISKFLTRSVISTTLPAREMTSTVSHYKGLSVELPARAKTSGELSFVFAENESFIISDILEQMLKYARNDMFYEFDSSIISNYLNNSNNADIKQYVDNIDLLNAAISSYRKYIDNYAHEFNILVKLYRASDAKIYSDFDEDEYPTFVYFFKGCDVSKVNQFKLDYNSDKPIDITASFMYQYFEEMTYEEYLLRYSGWNDGLDDPMFEATQEEMIAMAEASSPLTLVTHRHVYGVDLERS